MTEIPAITEHFTFRDGKIEYRVLSQPYEGGERRWVEERYSGGDWHIVPGSYGVATQLVTQRLTILCHEEAKRQLEARVAVLERENAELRKFASALVPLPDGTTVLSVDIKHRVTKPEEPR